MSKVLTKVIVAAMLAGLAPAAWGQGKQNPSQLAGLVDRRLEEKWAKGVQAAPQADDAEFLRRVYLDLIGRIPRVSEVRAFMEDSFLDKRRRVVDELLASPQFVSHFATTWQKLILPQTTNQQFQFLGGGFKTWLEQQIQNDVPYDKMVRQILTASLGNNSPEARQLLLRGGPPQGLSPIAFYQINEQKPENLAASVSRIFLGVKLECAQCHDHPFARWSRHQFWEMAAFFTTVQPPQRFVPGQGVERVVFKPREIKIPGTDKTVKAHFLDGKDPQWQEGADPRAALADWLTSAKNPFFARTAVNRVWAHFLGVGLIDPVDDEATEDNPVSHPELLAELAEQFIAHDFDVKYLIRALTASRAYQRASAQTHASQADPRAFARMSVRGLTPEQLFDSLAMATGYRDNNPQAGRFAVGFNPNSARGDFLNRFASQERVTEKQTSILQALALMNGKFIGDATSLDRSTTLGAVIDAPFFSAARKIETLYLATLSRLPRPEEMDRLLGYVAKGGVREDQRTAYTDVFWALLNSSEFVLNH